MLGVQCASYKDLLGRLPVEFPSDPDHTYAPFYVPASM